MNGSDVVNGSMPLAIVQGDAWPFHWSSHSPTRLVTEHGLQAKISLQPARTAFNEWQCPRWTGEMCLDGKEASCKRGAVGANGKGLSCIKKRCVCKENSCYIAQTGQCVQDGCNVALAQIAAIQSVGGVGSPSAQAAALRAGHQIEEQSLLQQDWMPPPHRGKNEVTYLWSQELKDKAIELRDGEDYEGSERLKEVLKEEPVLNKPLTHEQVEELEKALKGELSSTKLRTQFKIKTEDKVAYFWTEDSKNWAITEGKKQWGDDEKQVAKKLFDKVKDEHHVAPGQPVSKKQAEQLQKLAPKGEEDSFDWRTAAAAEGKKFDEDEIVKATYRFKNEGIAVLQGEEDFRKVREEYTAMYGPVRGNSIVPDVIVKAFEDRYGTMDRANEGGRLFEKDDGTIDAASSNSEAMPSAPAEVAMPKIQTVVVSRGSTGNNKELQELASQMGSLSEKLENLADHRPEVMEETGSEAMQSVPGCTLVTASFAPCLPRQSCAVACPLGAPRTSMPAARARWSAFFPRVSDVVGCAI